MELRFISRDGDVLTFEAPDGTRHTTLFDESLRDALRRPDNNGALEISPKEIQQRLRQGESIEDLALEMGVTVSSLEPFAAPILDELRFVLEGALAAEIADGNHMTSLGAVLERDQPGSKTRVYREKDSWLLEVTGENVMRFRYDMKLRQVEPLDSNATNLTLLHSQRDLVTATTAVPSEPAPTYQGEIYAQEVEEEHTASVLDLVEQIRARRQNSETTVKPAPAKGRTSLPSWNEIVLGTSNSEADSDQRDF
jgi:hypothetical protein